MSVLIVAAVAVAVAVAVTLVLAFRNSTLRRELVAANAHVEDLSRYQAIVDADAHAAEVLSRGENRAPAAPG
jgi:hypothetical protein